MSDRFAVRIVRSARTDLEALYEYVSASRSIEEADDLLSLMSAKIQSLETFPRRGPVPQEATAFAIGEIRQTLVGPYRLIYRIIDKTVFIVLIADGRRDIQTLLRQRVLA